MRKSLALLVALFALAAVPAALADPMTTRLFESNSGGVTVTVDVTFDNVTGEVSGLSWVVPSGTLKMTIQRAGQPDLVLTRTSSGSTQVPPNRFFLVQDRGGGWSWRQTSYSIGWNP